MRRLVVLILAGAATLAPTRTLQAQPDQCATVAASVASAIPLTRLKALQRVGCLGDARDANPLTRAATKSLPATLADTASATEIRLVVLSVIDPVARATREERDRMPEGSAPRVQLVALDSVIALTRGAVVAGLPVADVALLQTGTWAWDPASGTFGALPIDVAAALTAACTQPAAESCTNAFQSATFVLRAAKLVERALAYNARPLLTAALAHTTMRDSRWTAYFDETLVQFPWELLFNSVRFTRAARARSGFVMPPSDQWVLLHPMVGVEYLWSEPQGSRMKPAVAMEVLGYNRWSWSAANKPKGAWGASAVVSYSDRPQANGVGYGVLIRYQHTYALSVTSLDGKAAVLLSSELGTWLNSKQEKAKDAMRVGR